MVYEPATCSFLSPDPLIADEGNWLNYNRYLYCLGNPVKFADPTGMQVNNSYDVEGVLPRFVPQSIYEPEEFQYIVTDNSWEEQAMATVRFNNAMYELNRVVTAGANNAMAFIGHDRDAAVQRALANAAVASAQADAAARAAGDVGRNATIGPYSGSFNEWMVETPENFFHAKKYNGHSIVDIGSIISGSIGISTAWTEQVLADAGVDLLRNCGTAGKIMGGASVSMGIAGTVLGVVSGWKTKESGNPRGYLDIGVAFAGGGTAIAMTIGIIGTGGWFVVIPCAIYGIAVGIYDW
ncbi:MAG: RHS repeat-associated core domain-containing protein [Paludibacteraceae bacterium]|nr:RHS repeat-associated core domain-containing protein [Paludibacteraceae bacterium]